jgi:hypothetical protein
MKKKLENLGISMEIEGAVCQTEVVTPSLFIRSESLIDPPRFQQRPGRPSLAAGVIFRRR